MQVLKVALIGAGGFLLLRNSGLLDSVFGGGSPAPAPAPAGGGTPSPSGGGGGTAVPTPGQTPAGSTTLPTGGGGTTTTPISSTTTPASSTTPVASPGEAVIRAAALSAANAAAAGSWRMNFHQWNYYRHAWNDANPGQTPLATPDPGTVGMGDGMALITATEYHAALRSAGLSGFTAADENDYYDLQGLGALARSAAGLGWIDEPYGDRLTDDNYYSWWGR